LVVPVYNQMIAALATAVVDLDQDWKNSSKDVDSMNIIDILQACPLFSEVGAAGFRRLATIGRISNFRKGQTIFRENEPCPGVYVVGQGMVRVFKTGASGKEHVLHIVGPGESFAEVAAIGGFPVPATAEAEKKTACALLPMDSFRKALQDDHELCLGVLAGVTTWVRRLVTLMEDLALRDAAGRLARFLLELAETQPKPEGLVRLPGLKRHVASHLNLTSETFSRTLRRLVAAGLIAEVGSAGVRILHPKKLGLVASGMFPKF
jgi:CRP/FNR family transcriptional regulator, dissimilatory nitrate respiration regulator